ncbi:glycoside hydrolase family 95 protein [Coprobacillus cateniformis]|nr:glycoside hydrolase family 95 protein [Coprobacillus cateniformis]
MKKLIFNKPALQWEEAMPLGNGYLGAMVFGQTQKELICMNEDSLYSGGPIERGNPNTLDHLDEMRTLLLDGKVEEAQKKAPNYFYATTPHPRHYQPLGQVWMEFHHQNVQDYQKVLDLKNSIGSIQYRYNNVEYQRECFISYPNQVFVYKIKASQNQQLNFDLYLTRRDIRPGRSESYVDDIHIEKDYLYLSGYNGNQKNGISYTMATTVQLKDGCLKKYGSRLVIENATEAIVYVVGRTSYRSHNPFQWCQKQLDKTLLKSYRNLKQDHIRDYQNYFDQLELTLGDHKNENMMSIPERLQKMKEGQIDLDLIETYFHFGRYLLISSSREGSLAANLQGIWNGEFEPPWGSRYTININIQMNYWLAEKTGLSRLHLPLMQLQKIMLPRGQKIAKEMYGCRGTCAHHNTDIWGDCAPADYYVPSTLWPMGSLWLSLHIFEHYQYTHNQEFILEYFPILKENALFFLDYMFKDANGFYATGPSVSPENAYMTQDGQAATVCLSPSMDIQLLREFFTSYLQLLKELNRHDLEAEINEYLEKLPPIQIGKYGQIMEWHEDYDEIEIGHRHISQLFALYPGRHIQYSETPELIEAAYQTLQRRLSHGGGHTGWSCAWIIHFFARLHKGEEAFDTLLKLLKNSTLDNLFDNHPPFQIDGNFGGSNAILEMLIQDYENKVYVLPALSREMPEGILKGLRLKSGAVLNMSWKDCQVSNIEIIATRPLTIDLLIQDKTVSISLQVNEKFQYEAMC